MEEHYKPFSRYSRMCKTLTLSTSLAFALLSFEGRTCLSDSTYFPPEFEATLDNPPAEKEQTKPAKKAGSKKEKFKTLLQNIDDIPSKSTPSVAEKDPTEDKAEAAPVSKGSNPPRPVIKENLPSEPSEDELMENAAPLSEATHPLDIKDEAAFSLATPEINDSIPSKDKELEALANEDDLLEEETLAQNPREDDHKVEDPLTLVKAEATQVVPAHPAEEEKKEEEVVAGVPAPTLSEPKPEEKVVEEVVAITPAPTLPEPKPEEKVVEEVVAITPAPTLPEPKPEEKVVEEVVAITPAPTLPEPKPEEKVVEEVVAITPAPTLSESKPEEKVVEEVVAISPSPKPEEKVVEEVVAITPAPTLSESKPEEKVVEEVVAITPAPTLPESKPEEKDVEDVVAISPSPKPEEKVVKIDVGAVDDSPAPALPQPEKMMNGEPIIAAPAPQGQPESRVQPDKKPARKVPSPTPIPDAKPKVVSLEEPAKQPLPLVSAPSPEKPLPPVKDVSAPQKEATLPKINVAPHPEAKPLAEEKPEAQHTVAQIDDVVADTSILKDRTPIAVLDAKENPSSQQWILFSSVKRNLKSPSDVVDIVCVFGKDGISPRGEAVKSILISKGIKPNQIRLIHAKGEDNQTDQVFLFIENKKQ